MVNPLHKHACLQLHHVCLMRLPACQQVAEVLGHIEAGGLLPPLVVLQALARNPALKLAVVREYMARALGAEAAAADEDRAAVARYQAETAGMRAEVTELRTQVPALPHGHCTHPL